MDSTKQTLKSKVIAMLKRRHDKLYGRAMSGKSSGDSMINIIEAIRAIKQYTTDQDWEDLISEKD